MTRAAEDFMGGVERAPKCPRRSTCKCSPGTCLKWALERPLPSSKQPTEKLTLELDAHVGWLYLGATLLLLGLDRWGKAAVRRGAIVRVAK